MEPLHHFSHQHPLIFNEEQSHESEKQAYCSTCGDLVSGPSFGCEECGFYLDKKCAEAPSQLNHPFHRKHSLELRCNFFLHKSCTELPRKKQLWLHSHTKPHQLTSNRIFSCACCWNESSGFAYTCDECNICYCLRCALISDTLKCQGHEHPLSFQKYEGLCNACGQSLNYAQRCKSCNFSLDWNCLTLPLKARHKSDVHHFTLTYHDNDYPKSHYCDICEEKRNPNYWFYHCVICDNSAHPKCVLEKYPFIKLGNIYTEEGHPHPLTFVQKVHYYPECQRCGKPCLDMALECKTIGCSYIVHWECIKPRF